VSQTRHLIQGVSTDSSLDYIPEALFHPFGSLDLTLRDQPVQDICWLWLKDMRLVRGLNRGAG
jgi:hypothetical protein